jgi:orotidine-5'-phosphate decarboxylase
MSDQIIDATMARALHVDACRAHALVGWLVMQDLPEYPDKVVARLVTDAPSPYVLAADTLAGIHDQLPPRLVRKEPQPADPPEVVEIWFASV